MTDISPIGISHAEMQLYAEYINQKAIILDEITTVKKKKEYLVNSMIKTSSIISITSSSRYKDVFYDYMSDFIVERDILDQRIKALEVMRDIRTEYCERIEEHLAKLGADDKRLINLRYFDKLTLEQIAEKVHSNRQTVNERIHKILKFQTV